jgi:hypothetical protein
MSLNRKVESRNTGHDPELRPKVEVKCHGEHRLNSHSASPEILAVPKPSLEAGASIVDDIYNRGSLIQPIAS